MASPTSVRGGLRQQTGKASRNVSSVRCGLKQWWFKNAAGSVLLTVRYGAKLLPIAIGMTASPHNVSLTHFSSFEGDNVQNLSHIFGT